MKIVLNGQGWCGRTCIPHIVLCLVVLQCLGCASSSPSSGSTGGGGTSSTSLTGNWEFLVGSPTGAPFTKLSGFVNETQSTQVASTLTTASLQVQSNSCFAGSRVLDLQGYHKDTTAQLSSIPSFSQTVRLDLSTQCTGGLSLCGGYTVTGGCADGASGTLQGVQYSQLTGSFETPSGVIPDLTLQLTQPSQGTGEGSYQVSGTAKLIGGSCFTSGTLDPLQSTLSGSALHVVAVDGTGQSLMLDGAIDAGATVIYVNAVSSTTGTCVASLTGSRLSRTGK